MKAILKTAGGRLAFEITGEKVKDVFREIAHVQEIFDAEQKCGICGSPDIRFLARQVEEYDFYELACMRDGCRARFAFGQNKKGGALFPKRKDEDGNWLPNGGWSKYEKPGVAPATAGKPEPAGGAPQQEAAAFPTWEAAERSQHYGDPQIKIAGTLYQMNDEGNYTAARNIRQ